MQSYILHPDLYKKAKSVADKTYKRHSAYKSMFIQKLYKSYGGKYTNTKKTKKVIDWKNEKWIQIEPYVLQKKQIACGKLNKTKACRPLKKIRASISMNDILHKFGEKKILSLVKRKQKDMNGRLNWKKGTFTPSK
tara:strand:+ start:74 stop:481 length:408 start_codon:yes stop_codon:yes gene_type:complete